MVKGLAKLGNRIRHGLLAKYVDVHLFRLKRGYSPMTPGLYHQATEAATAAATSAQSFTDAESACADVL